MAAESRLTTQSRAAPLRTIIDQFTLKQPRGASTVHFLAFPSSVVLLRAIGRRFALAPIGPIVNTV
jgi:hypothetical protein